MTDPRNITREMVQQRLDYTSAYRSNRSIDRAIAAATRDLEGKLNRKFYPTTATLRPNPRLYVISGVLWLDSGYEMCRVDTVTVDGTALAAGTDFYTEPEDGPPFTSIELYPGSTAAWPSDKGDIVLTGQAGSSIRTRPAGLLAASINASVTSVTVSDSSLVGVGDLLWLDTERVVVTDKMLGTTTATLAADTDAQYSSVSLSVSDGTLLHEGEMIVIGSERMAVEMIAGNTITVRRAELGSALAAHLSTAVIYAPRIAVVERAATGTTAAEHTSGIALAVNDPPDLVQEATLALALNNFEQAKAGYARTTGTGEGESESSGRGVRQIVADCMEAYGKVRIGVSG